MRAWAALLALLLPGLARAQDPSGTWFPVDGVQPRYLWVVDGRACFEQRWDGVGELRLEGGPHEDGWLLEGRCDARQGASLELVPAGDGWQVLLRRGSLLRRERWYRSGPGAVELGALRLARDGLRIGVEVRGRPLRLTLQVRSSDPRWEVLGGLVHHASVGPLPVGHHLLRWDLRERGWREARVPPGDYAIQVAPADEGLPALGGEEGPAGQEVWLALAHTTGPSGPEQGGRREEGDDDVGPDPALDPDGLGGGLVDGLLDDRGGGSPRGRARGRGAGAVPALARTGRGPSAGESARRDARAGGHRARGDGGGPRPPR